MYRVNIRVFSKALDGLVVDQELAEPRRFAGARVQDVACRG